MRLTTRRLMIVVAVAALALAAWVAIDRNRFDPYRDYLVQERGWCQNRSEWFHQIDWEVGIVRKFEPECLLKVTSLGSRNPQIQSKTNLVRCAIGRNGDHYITFQRAWSTGGPWGRLPPEKMGRIRTTLALLPPTGPVTSNDAVLLIGSTQKGRWTTRAYAEAALPAEVRLLFEALDISIR